MGDGAELVTAPFPNLVGTLIHARVGVEDLLDFLFGLVDARFVLLAPGEATDEEQTERKAKDFEGFHDSLFSLTDFCLQNYNFFLIPQMDFF